MQRIDRAADVVDGGVADDLDRPQFEIDLDFADMAAIGKAADRDGLIAFGGQGSAQIGGEIVAAHRLACRLEYADGAVGTLHGESAAGEFDVVLGRFEHVGSDPLALGDDRVRRLADDDAGEPHRAAGMRSAAHRHDVGIALDADARNRAARPANRVTSCAKLVSWPCPLDSVPITTSTRPSGATVTSAHSRGAPVVNSM